MPNVLTVKLIVCVSFLFFARNSSAQYHICVDPIHTKTSPSNFAGFGVFMESNTWPTGSTIKVKFMNGSSYLHSKVRQYANEWTRHANVKFQYVTSGNGDIRINFDASGGSWSNIGTDAKQIAQHKPTMNFGWFDASTTENVFRRTILHEFGHALGLLHEHQNPNARINWNKAKVYAYYTQRQGWTREQVDQNIFSRYSVSHSNGIYDPSSIMHYPIPPEFTTDGTSIGWNTELSTIDKRMAGEIYPFPKTPPPLPTSTQMSAIFKDLKVEHNAYDDQNRKGMYVKAAFNIKNSRGQTGRMITYFHNADGGALRDKNGQFHTTDGKVSTSVSFTPKYDDTDFTKLSTFIPYEELHVGSGEFRLKVTAYIWYGSKLLAKSAYKYFTYQNGVVCESLKAETLYDVDGGLEIYPVFTLKNGENSTYRISAYFHSEDGPLYDYNGEYNTTDGKVAVGGDINPCCTITNYNMGTHWGFKFYIPYSEFHLRAGYKHNLKYQLVLWDGNRAVAESSWVNFWVQM